jgi:hypothetical protein
MLTYFALLVVLQVIIKRISDEFLLAEQYACSIWKKMVANERLHEKWLEGEGNKIWQSLVYYNQQCIDVMIQF